MDNNPNKKKHIVTELLERYNITVSKTQILTAKDFEKIDVVIPTANIQAYIKNLKKETSNIYNPSIYHRFFLQDIIRFIYYKKHIQPLLDIGMKTDHANNIKELGLL